MASGLEGAVDAEFFEHGKDVGRKRGLDLDDCVGEGVLETQAAGVQGLTLEQYGFVGRVATNFAACDSRSTAILSIAQHGAADVVQMNTNLVGATGLGHGFHRRKTGETLLDLVERLRGATVGMAGTNRHLLANVWMKSDGAIDEVAVVRRAAADQGEVFLLDRAPGELLRELIVRLIVAGDQDHAARVAVEAMNDARATQSAGAAERWPEMKLQRAGKRPRPVAASRMDDHAGRFVDNDDVFVFKKDFEGDVLGTRGLAGQLGQRDDNALARLEAIGRLAASAVDRNAAGRDDATQMHPAVIGKMTGKEGVKPVTGFGRLDRQLDRLR